VSFVHITAGTTERESETHIQFEQQSEISGITISAGGGAAFLFLRTEGIASGGISQDYKVTRVGKVTLSIDVLLRMFIVGLKASEYRISERELHEVLSALVESTARQGDPV
jgi:hypothetical protein